MFFYKNNNFATDYKPSFKERYKYKINGNVYSTENIIPVKVKNGKVKEYPKKRNKFSIFTLLLKTLVL